MGLQLPKWMIQLTGDLYLHRFPFWFVYKPHHYAVTGSQVRSILNEARPGDILLRRYEGFLNTIFTPGFWGHAALCVEDTSVIHAIGAGVVKEDLITFCRTDAVSLVRIKGATEEQKGKALACAHEHAKQRTAYDYRFKDRNHAVYCTELVNVCYENLFGSAYEKVFGDDILRPYGIRKSPKIELVREYHNTTKSRYESKLAKTYPACTGEPQTCEETLKRRKAEIEKHGAGKAPKPKHA
ncbi:MAG: YiiX/YebB-like N1pC/P60 family cysteine hydrolase [Nitrospiraceae bacterium]|nr:YiiX/YebB-like N1pC/P60 family cysteine hydrolase [Nitrospiraceae bacterium]